MENTTTAKATFAIHPGTHEVIASRVFDAPIDRVYNAYTDPEIIPKWLGPRRLTMSHIAMDIRPGGMWQFVHQDTDGTEYGFHGVVHDVVPRERIVQTFEYDGMPGHVSLDTATFEDLGGKTKVTVQSIFQSVGDRDGMVKSGMQDGMSEGWDRLAEIVER